MAIVENVKQYSESSNQKAHPVASTYLPSFEETHKMAYSHGLEAVYALKDVDLKTISRLQPQLVPSYTSDEYCEKQLEFDLGDSYRGWMESFVLREPIHVLGLSRHAERCLIDNGKSRLLDLIGNDLRDFAFYKGMGQGHLDEIRHKLCLYLEQRPLYRCTRIDFAAWMRSLFASFDRKKVYLALQPYKLNNLLSLSAAENVEIGHLTQDKKTEYTQEMFSLFQSESCKLSIDRDLERIMRVFVIPWMQRRHSMASRGELLERIQNVSVNPVVAQQAMQFFDEVYFNRVFACAPFLYQVDKECYCADATTADFFNLIVERAHSYFYKDHISYSLTHLLAWLEREFARQWQGFATGFLEKVIRRSSCFRTRKDREGVLMVRLA